MDDPAQSMALLTQLKDVQIAAQAMVSASDPALIEQSNQLLQTRKNELQASLSEQAKQADSKAQQGLIEQVQEGLTNYFKAIDDVAKFATQGQRDMAEAMMSANVLKPSCSTTTEGSMIRPLPLRAPLPVRSR
ncbi:hypothetical protein [Salmonella enterica]|uniref:hypothetical protein n=1 Tax=Salmonella enterica TaxID=28901 RepID=UPI001CA47032|nr:hypothetical protein [Salmonella enterica]